MRNFRRMIARYPNAESDDFYATDPKAALALLAVEPQLKDIWEPSCGMGHLSKVFEMKGLLAKASDLRDRGCTGAEVLDFLSCYEPWDGDIVTNPPFSIGVEFCLKALELVPQGRYVCMFLPLTYLESQRRYAVLFRHQPPMRIHVFCKRLHVAKNAAFDNNGSMRAYAWFVWQKGFEGSPTVYWIPEEIYD